ncbi:MAG TPA: formate dehydrogenase accessory sulfurtransferase FdhD [Thermoanaerobaculia bacterium]|jgi:FdhD protein
MDRVVSVPVTRVPSRDAGDDAVAVEEPLEISAGAKTISVTMRTPGDDFDLALGFLFTEGLLRKFEEVESVRHWGSPNRVRVTLREGVQLDASKLDRHFYTTSSCGVCGKTSIDAVRIACGVLPPSEPFRAELVQRLGEPFADAQTAFRATGSMHAAALFDRDGKLVALREDIGRHNAVDKVIGALFRESATPLRERLLFVSSRASFEIVQKAAVAGIPAVAAVGGPSSLAIELARDLNVTLLGFVRDGRFNVYAGGVA